MGVHPDLTAHTPGPWDWDCGIVPPDGPERYSDIYTEGGDLIIARFNDLIPEGLANARLIAAAPELLGVAKRLFPKGIATNNRNIPDSQIIPVDVTMGELRMLAAAIAKATEPV
jgi:hypothetical protein